MCFSATGSFSAGIVLLGAGVATVKVARKKYNMPLATVPFFFGIQQVIEGFIWLSFKYSAFASLNQPLTYLYSIFAYIFWPIFVPFIIGYIEPAGWRKNVLYAFQFIGLFTGGYLLYIHQQAPVTCQIVNHSLVYSSTGYISSVITASYLIATVGSILISSKAALRFLGVLTGISAAIAYYYYAAAFVSVWCFFAALLSFFIYVYVAEGAKVKKLKKNIRQRLRFN